MTENQTFDLIVLGGGPGGYVAAIRAAQLGLATAVVEREHLGGVCLNWGCIPTKALLRTSEIYHLLHRLDEFGLSASGVSFDFPKVIKRSRKVAKQLSDGVKHLMKKHKVTVFDGQGRLDGAGKVSVQKGGKTTAGLTAPNIILATGARARELLTELMPALLDALGKTANPDAAFMNFDAFLKGQSAGVQLLALLKANPGLLDLLAEITGSAPRLAAYLTANPSLLDGVLSAGFFEVPPGGEVLSDDLAGALEQARNYEDVLEISRRWTNDRKFQVGVQIMRNNLDADGAGRALADIAETVLARLFAIVREEFAGHHGLLGDGAMAVVGLGKLGGRELTENADLDLLFVYDNPQGLEHSDGQRPLAVSQYFARLSQRLISALSALTSEGKLYEVDMRLRPAGNAGPIASSFEGFGNYQREAAWTWEHMALTRARVVAGGEGLTARLEATIGEILTARRDEAQLVVDVADMRERLERGHPPGPVWDVKYFRGGLIDVEFIAQYLQLRHAHEDPGVLSTSTVGALERLSAAGFLEPDIARFLIGANRLWRNVQGVLRLTVAGTFDEAEAPVGLKTTLARAAGASSPERPSSFRSISRRPNLLRRCSRR